MTPGASGASGAPAAGPVEEASASGSAPVTPRGREGTCTTCLPLKRGQVRNGRLLGGEPDVRAVV